MQATIAELNRFIRDKNAYIAHLESAFARQERELARKQALLDSQADLLKRIEQGRVMRTINVLTSRKSRPKPKREPRMHEADS